MIKQLKQVFEEDVAESGVLNEDSNDFIELKTEDGDIFRMEVLAVDEIVKEVTEDGLIDVADGTYVMEDGSSLVIKDDIISEIIEADADEADSAEEFAEISAVIKYKLNVTADTIEVGTTLVQTDEEGNTYSVDAGEYELEDGRTIQVDADSIVVLISDEAGKTEDAIDDKSDADSADSADATDEESFKAVVKEMKGLISKFKSVSKDLNLLKDENKVLKAKVNKFAKEASVSHTNTKFSYKPTESKNRSILQKMYK